MSKRVDPTEVLLAQGDVSTAERLLHKAEEGLLQKHAEIHERISTGDKTDDPLVDFVILRKRRVDFETVALFIALEERVAEHAGEPVLVIAREADIVPAHKYLRPPRHLNVVERLGVGLLNGPRLTVGKEGEWSFPTDSYVFLGPGQLSGEVVERPLTTDLTGTKSLRGAPLEGVLDTEVSFPPGVGAEWTVGDWKNVPRPKRLEIAIGAAEIEAFGADKRFDREQYDAIVGAFKD